MIFKVFSLGVYSNFPCNVDIKIVKYAADFVLVTYKCVILKK